MSVVVRNPLPASQSAAWKCRSTTSIAVIPEASGIQCESGTFGNPTYDLRRPAIPCRHRNRRHGNAALRLPPLRTACAGEGHLTLPPLRTAVRGGGLGWGHWRHGNAALPLPPLRTTCAEIGEEAESIRPAPILTFPRKRGKEAYVSWAGNPLPASRSAAWECRHAIAP